DVTADDAQQYKGWPVTIDQMDNYGRKAMAYLPTFHVSGINDPVIQIIYEPTEEIVYTVRIKGNQIQPKVFKDGLYTVKIGEQPDQMKTYPGLDAQEEEENDQVIHVAF